MSGEAPEEWREARLGDYCRIEIGGTPSRDKPQFWSNDVEGHPWASIADLKASRVSRTKEFISALGIANSNVKLVPRGTVMMSFKLTIGRTAFAGDDLYTNEAIAAYVAHIGDDDVWFPNHLAALERVLERSDFGNVLQADVLEHGGIRLHTGDLANAQTRQRMCEEAYNFFGPSSAGYRLSAYRRLPEGWAPAPSGVWTDLHMWRKFLVRKDMSFGTEFSITLMKISAAERTHLPIEFRESESRGLVTQFAEGSNRDAFIACAFKETILSLSEHATALVRDHRANDTIKSELLTALERDLSNARADLRNASTQLAQCHEHLATLQNAALERDDLLSTSWADLRNANIQLAQCHEHLASLQIVALERDNLLLSTSWAVTRPLRWLKRLLTARRT